MSLGVRSEGEQAPGFASECCTFLGSGRRLAGVLETAEGHSLAGAQYLSEVTAGSRLAGTSLLGSVMHSRLGVCSSELCEFGGWQGLLYPAKQDDHLCRRPLIPSSPM